MLDNLTDDNETQRADVLNVLRQINFVLYPIICLVGFAGNIFSVVVIFMTNLRKISSNHYLVALALSDTVFLVALFMMWLSKFGAPTYHARGSCESVLFMLNCSSWLSSWYITALTVERFYVVYRPLSKRTVCTVKRTRITVLCLIPWPVLFNIWVMFGGGITEAGFCNILSDYQSIGSILNWIDTILSFVLPVAVIVYCNSSICVKLCQDPVKKESSIEMRKHSGKSHDGSSSHKSQRQERKITQSLLIISCIFVAMNLPSYAMRLRLYILALTTTDEEQAQLSVVAEVLHNFFFLLYYANFSINFFVYSLSSDNFRKAVKIMLMGFKGRNRNLTLSTYSEDHSSTVRKKTYVTTNDDSRIKSDVAEVEL